MKTLCLPLLFLFSFFQLHNGIAQNPESGSILYVHHAATGLNDGSSWENAFVDLQTAIQAVDYGDQLWVAKGTYLPGDMYANPDSSFFMLSDGVSLYGGFAGTEISLAERDIENNPTILSGDLNGDDVPGEFNTNREDNCIHVLWADSTISAETFLDGFIIEGGHTDKYPPTSVEDWNPYSGGGIICSGKPTIQNCTFRDNFAYTGGGIQVSGSQAEDLLIKDCIFDGNLARYWGAGLATAFLPSLELTDCNFINNEAELDSGAGVLIRDGNATIRSCTFSNNEAPWGGAVFNYNIYEKNFFVTIDSCLFEYNVANISAGAVHNYSSESGYRLMTSISNSTFLSNSVKWENGTGGAVTVEGNVDAYISDCLFDGNKVDLTSGSGGAIEAFFGGRVYIQRSTFNNNQAGFGGAVDCVLSYGDYHWADSLSYVDIRHCEFMDNLATFSGGACLFTWQGSGKIQNSNFTNNTADYGGAVGYAGEPDLGVIPTLEIHSSRFWENIGNIESAAIGAADADDLLLSNCLIARSGGAPAITQRGNGVDPSSLILRNCTIVDNPSGINIQNEVEVTFENTILDNPQGMNLLLSGSGAQISSEGGNLSSGDFLSDILNATNDDNGMDPGFIGETDFHLSQGSPCIDRGINNGALPEFDLEGNPRIAGNAVDKGAYESPFTVSYSLPGETGARLQVLPNPVSDQAIIQLESSWRGKVYLRLTDIKGNLVKTIHQSINENIFQFSWDVSDLPAGMYELIIYFGKEKVSERMIIH
jgi:hypothetical protein